MNKIIKFIKRYWVEILLFGVILAVFMIDLAPNMTWINTNSDGVHLTYAAKYMYPAHKGSSPVYLLLGHLVLQFPVGTDFWRMGLLSAIPAAISAVFVYLIVKKLIPENKNKKWYAVVGSLVYGSSALIISQATIVKYYSLVTMIGLLAYLLCLNKKWIWVSICLGVAGAIHPIALFFIVPLFIKYKELRRWKNITISASFVLFYLYVPITNRPPYMWEESSQGIFGFIKDTFSTAGMLSGTLSIFELPKRIFDTIGILGISWGLGIIGIGIYTWKVVKNKVNKWYKDVVLWIVITSIVYFVIDLAPQTYVYMLPAIAFGCILIAIGLSKVRKELAFTTVGVAIIMLGFNANYFDIGRTLDKNLEATEFYTAELNKVPNGGVFLAKQAWEWAMVYLYNKENGRNIIPVVTGNLSNVDYMKLVQGMGINLTIPTHLDSLHSLDVQNEVIDSIIKYNSTVWISYGTDEKDYGGAITEINNNNPKEVEFAENDLIISEISIEKASSSAIKWIPNNPYDFITGRIEVTQWRLETLSNYNCLMFLMLGFIGFAGVWFFQKIVIDKKEWKISNVKEKIKEIK